MTQIKFNKVNALPATPAADSFYFILNGSHAEAYLTDASGTAKSIGNSTMIAAIAQGLINSALADFNGLEIAANIAARNALATGKQRNFIVLVSDATGDSTVSAGAALYAWNEANAQWIKLAEFESMDLTLQWSNIQGRPTSSAAQIDAAVQVKHSHTNLTLLEKIAEDANGNLTYNGSVVASNWTTTNW